MEATTARQTGDGVGATPTTEPNWAPRATLAITADPAPLGLCGFALTTFVLSMFNAGLVNPAGEPVVLGLAVAYGGLAQFLAGMWAFRRGDTFAATAFSSYGAFWLSFFVLVQFLEKSIPAAHAGDAIGLYLIGWGIFTAGMWLVSFSRSIAVMLVLAALTVTYFLLGIGNAGDYPNIVKAGGYAGLVTAFVAFYAAVADLFENAFFRTVLPQVPLRKSRLAGIHKNV
jgi:succinate-acetate transporter protein